MSTPQCPMRSAAISSAQCPMRRDPAINPRNNMPDLPQSRAPHQTQSLPTDRVTSTIPRPPEATYGGQSKTASDGPSKWEYPSPQQFYNALMRKGWNTPEEHVEAMVLLHNRLNEDAWAEILQWEARFGGGSEEAAKLELVEFTGLHGHMTHKTWIYQRLRRYFPSYLIFSPPFDRHDWIVRRPRTGKKIRYVIDYYSTRMSVYHEPEFHLDVRPATDSFGNAAMKMVYPVENMSRRLIHCKTSTLSQHSAFVYVGLPFSLLVALTIVISTRAQV